MNSLRALVLGILCTSASAAELVSAVPKPFQGVWDTSPKGCSTTSDTRFELMKKRISFYESGGPLKAIVVNGQSELALIAELSGEGELWVVPFHFKLSEDGKSLTDVGSEKPMVWHRCQKAQ